MENDDQSGLANTNESTPSNTLHLHQVTDFGILIHNFQRQTFYNGFKAGIVSHPPYVTVGVEDLSMVIAQNADMIHRFACCAFSSLQH